MAFTAPTTRATDYLVTAAVWNAEHVDNMNTAFMHLIARKTSDQTVTNSTVLVNDTALKVTLAANEVWLVSFKLWYSTPAAADMKVAFSSPSGNSHFLRAAGLIQPATATLQDTYWTSANPGAESAFGQQVVSGEFIVIEGITVNGANAGDLQLQWAQNTANASGTVMKTNSTVWGVKLA